MPGDTSNSSSSSSSGKEVDKTIKPLMPVYFNTNPIQDFTSQDDISHCLTFKMRLNYITTSLVQSKCNDDYMTWSKWEAKENDIELLKMNISRDKEKNDEAKIHFSYCFNREALDKYLKCDDDDNNDVIKLADLYPLPIQKQIYIPHATNISVNEKEEDNTADAADAADVVDEDDKHNIVSIKLLDMKNNSNYGPMLLVTICNINKKNMYYSKYCKKISNIKECDLFQVYIIRNKCIGFRFPDSSPKIDEETIQRQQQQDERRRRPLTMPLMSTLTTKLKLGLVKKHILNNWHIYCGVFFSTIAYSAFSC